MRLPTLGTLVMGTASNDVNPVHTYDDDGFYTVTLTATNDCGSHSLPIQIPVFTQPSAGFSADPSSGCASLNVQFTSTSSTNVTTYSWEFEGGSPATSTDQHPVVNYSAPGVYDVTLTVSNPAGADVLTETAFIEVSTVASPSFDVMVSGNTATFTNTSTASNGGGAMSFHWDFGDGNESTDESPSHNLPG